jgi:mono/diheme cytochrome c family protein
MKLRLVIVILFTFFAVVANHQLQWAASGKVRPRPRGQAFAKDPLTAARASLQPARGGAGAPVFLTQHCTACHSATTKKGNLDLTALAFTPANPDNLRVWVRIHDRVSAGEMPPKGIPRPEASEISAFLSGLAADITAYERQAAKENGRATRRRLNAYEYENVLRDLFQAPWLQIRSRLPEDGEAHHFNKSAEALDVSHVLMSRYMKAADYAMRQVLSTQLTRPPTTTTRYYAREQRSMIGFPEKQFSSAVDKRPFPLLDLTPQPLVRERKAPVTEAATRDREAVGWVMSAFAPGVMYGWDSFRAPVAGRYRVRLSGYTVWVGNAPDAQEKGKTISRKHLPDYDRITRGRRSEPMALYTKGGLSNRRIADFDLTPEPSVHDLGDLWLIEGESLTADPMRFFRRRGNGQNQLAQDDGIPGVAFRWLEIEGPIYDDNIAPGYRLLFGDLPIRKIEKPDEAPKASAFTGRLARGATPKDALDGVALEITSKHPERDAATLLRTFVKRAYRRPAAEADVQLFTNLVRERMKAGLSFCDAMIAGYTAVLVSPGFLFVDDTPGRLDDYALAARLALFLWNSEPDAALRARAARKQLHTPAALREETERMLNDPKSRRFVDGFLDYWIDARKVEATAPSATLYGDYDMDDALREAALAETQLFFADLIARDLPARNLIASDYTFLNERLARHYGVPNVEGAAMRRVSLPANSPRGGLMTQALVLKVTANGTTTSPVLRGKWITERLLGYEIPPPPPVAAVEPDIRGAVTIRQQLDQHRADASCASCHRRIDPPGFALESFDVMGGWRDRYRAVAEDGSAVAGRTKEGHPFAFRHTLPVDAAGELPDGRKFTGIHDFKKLLLSEEERVTRNLVHQLVLYATSAPVQFSDRATVQRILAQAKPREYGVRALIHSIVQSELFLHK